MVITRYLYKPTAAEGMTRFNDNRRLHIFIADIAHADRSASSRPVTTTSTPIDWSPRGDEILFVSNRGPDPDRFFNYDVFAAKVADGAIRRLTDTKSAEYRPDVVARRRKRSPSRARRVTSRRRRRRWKTPTSG